MIKAKAAGLLPALLTMALTMALSARPEEKAGGTYTATSGDGEGPLRIVTTDGREIRLTKEPGQVSFAQVRISPDARAVGWVAMFPNCCTSYPIPLKFVVYSRGQAKIYPGNGLPVWNWRFVRDGEQVAFHQETVHGGIGVHYELREVSSGRLVEQYDPGQNNSGAPPEWVKNLTPKALPGDGGTPP
ncbi:MAG: hypothetical protein R2762_25335 [Bryobacteraceae bacterium]